MMQATVQSAAAATVYAATMHATARRTAAMLFGKQAAGLRETRE
jgi:hypothetical protein